METERRTKKDWTTHRIPSRSISHNEWMPPKKSENLSLDADRPHTLTPGFKFDTPSQVRQFSVPPYELVTPAPDVIDGFTSMTPLPPIQSSGVQVDVSMKNTGCQTEGSYRNTGTMTSRTTTPVMKVQREPRVDMPPPR